LNGSLIAQKIAICLVVCRFVVFIISDIKRVAPNISAFTLIQNVAYTQYIANTSHK